MTDNNTILVTGGAGYIGSHVCKELTKSGYNPVVYDNLVSGFEHAVKWGAFEQGDILDHGRLAQVMKEYKPQAVIHMAAHIAAGESVKLPAKYYRNNTMGGLTLLEAMKECGVKNIVFSSTAFVYGVTEKLPINEQSFISPITPYGSSKYMMEQILNDFEISDGIKHIVLRYFNAAGADAEGEIGCEHEVPNNLIPILMDVQTGRREKLEIFGADYDTPDGTAMRDYVHVTDLAAAHVSALKYMFDNDSATINLGTGKAHSVLEVVASVEKITGKKVSAVTVDRRAADPAKLVANAAKAKELLGWEAKYTNIDDIVKTAWDWQIIREKNWKNI